MSYEERDNSGSLFRVTEKKGDKFPDYEGKVLIHGRAMWVSGWIKEGKKGKFVSLAFKDRDLNQKPKTTNRARDERDEIPWD